MSDHVVIPRTALALRSPAYELFVASLSVLALVNVALYLLIPDPPLQSILTVMNGVLSVIFFFDFLIRARTADSFTAYFLRHFGWADLLSCVPVPLFKLLRLFRLVRAIRLFQAAGGRETWARLKAERANSALLSLLLMGLLVLEFGSLLILRIEQDAQGALIVNASDALWYTIVTIATVGYGDEYPVTDLGRIAGSVIIVIGVGIFGTFTGYLANLFLAPRHRRSLTPASAFPQAPVPFDPELSEPPDEPGPQTAEPDRLAHLEALLAQSQAMLAELRELQGRTGDEQADEGPRQV